MTYPKRQVDVIVVGSGAAGYGAALSLYDEGVKNVAVLSENRLSGTSRNTGSDKQTYYKLTLSGDTPDSVREMANSLYQGQLVDGDHALSEAALSTRAFYRLVNLGVPFPHTSYGEYVGYKTDHDPRERATSVGPYTSREMTKVLEKACANKGIAFFDQLLAVKILKTKDGSFKGLLCLDLAALEDPKKRFVLIEAKACVWATGGPACLYRDSVFPGSQHGASGVAFAAGVQGKNLTEWQYGLASVKPRWNVSGTYMQVLPRFISVDEDGAEHEFLFEHFTLYDALNLVFLKGYQWPFDVTKSENRSSQIDLLVHEETKRGRRVYLDFRSNPQGLEELDFSKLSSEARDYLETTGACFGTPIERLQHMNEPAIEFYLDHNVDLRKERLEIALCAQHNNGGLDVDENWMTNVPGLYAVGEVAGTHGVFRPGGSALNAGQVGGLRAAMHLSLQDYQFTAIEATDYQDIIDEVEQALNRAATSSESFVELQMALTRQMSEVAAAIRNLAAMQDLLTKVKRALKTDYAIPNPQLLPAYFRFRDLLMTMKVYLTAFCDYRETGGVSRGSALYLGDAKALTVDPQAIQLVDISGKIERRAVRPIPEPAESFENVWRESRQKDAKRRELYT